MASSKSIGTLTLDLGDRRTVTSDTGVSASAIGMIPDPRSN